MLVNLIVDSYLQIIRLHKLRSINKVVNRLKIQFKNIVTLRNLNSCHMMIHWKYWTTMMKMKYSLHLSNLTLLLILTKSDIVFIHQKIIARMIVPIILWTSQIVDETMT